MQTNPCYCGSNIPFGECCSLYINGIQKAPSAVALMRSRYTAYVIQNADYLIATTHLSTRKLFSKEEILTWSQENKWLRLEVLASTETTVTFKAYFLDSEMKAQTHHENSTFKREGDVWYYVTGE